MVSSTAVTLGFSRLSRDNETSSVPLAVGVIGACTVLVPRVLIISAAMNAEVAAGLLPLLLPAGLIGATTVALAWIFGKAGTGRVKGVPQHLLFDERSPLRFWVAIKLALVFQAAMIVVTLARQLFSLRGFYSTAVVLGLTDVDALTVSMSNPSASIAADIAAKAIAVGIVSNSVFKLTMSAIFGSRRFRLFASGILMAMIAASLLALKFFI